MTCVCDHCVHEMQEHTHQAEQQSVSVCLSCASVLSALTDTQPQPQSPYHTLPLHACASGGTTSVCALVKQGGGGWMGCLHVCVYLACLHDASQQAQQQGAEHGTAAPPAHHRHLSCCRSVCVQCGVVSRGETGDQSCWANK